MHEAVASALMFIILMGMTLTAYVYAMPNIIVFIRLREIDSSIAYMKRISQSTMSLMSGDAASSLLDMSAAYGIFSVVPSGRVMVLVGNTTLYGAPNVPHYVFQYHTSIGGFPNTHVLDRGIVERAFYSTPSEASLVYHYTNSTTFIVADQKVALTTETIGSSTSVVHILILSINSSSLIAVQQGPLTLSVNNAMNVQLIGVSGPVKVTVECGLGSDGAPLINLTQINTPTVDVFLTVLNVTVVQT